MKTVKIIGAIILLIGIVYLSSLISSEHGGEYKPALSADTTAVENYYWKDTTIVVSTETVFLKKDTVIRIYINLNEDLYCSGGGETYYRRPQNKNWVLQGGGIPVEDTEHSAFIDLKCNEKEITVTCIKARTEKIKKHI